MNGNPHIGTIYTQFVTEASALWWSMNPKRLENGKFESKKFYLSTGTDEHGLKIQQESELAKISPREFCDQASKRFRNVFDKCEMRYSNFIRTTDPEHIQNVQEFWEMIKKDIYLGEYEGWYCVSDESFVQETFERDGKRYSSESGKICEWVTEKNYKFRLSAYQNRIRKWLMDNPDVIQPKSKYNQVLAILEDTMKSDLSISRSSSRVSWGIPVPNDPTQTIYVWLDALTNYHTVGKSIGVWPPETQVIGKDILKFHAIYWPAFLMARGLELPKKLLVHGHWTVKGTKMSKSLGNVVDVEHLIEKFGPEYVRYYLLRVANLGDDTDFEMLENPGIMNELADTLGNLVSRMFAPKLHDGSVFKCGSLNDQDKEMIQMINSVSKLAKDHHNASDFKEATFYALKIARNANSYFESEKPWKADSMRLQTIKYIVSECIRVSSLGLYPIIPQHVKSVFELMGLDVENDLAIDLMRFHPNMTYSIPSNPPKLFKKF